DRGPPPTSPASPRNPYSIVPLPLYPALLFSSSIQQSIQLNGRNYIYRIFYTRPGRPVFTFSSDSITARRSSRGSLSKACNQARRISLLVTLRPALRHFALSCVIFA